MGDASTINSLGTFLSAAYNYSLKLVGLAVFLMFLYAGLKIILGQRSEAFQIMRNAVVGAVLLFSAYVILNTINRDLVGQTGQPIPSLKKAAR